MKENHKIWALYEKAKSVQLQMGLPADTDRAWHFYEGDQWYGLEEAETLPMYNFITPTVKYKVANVAMNQMQIYFNPLRSAPKDQLMIGKLNQLATRWWEQHKMDMLCWRMLRDSAVAGDAYLYIYNEQGSAQVLDRLNVFLADESISDLQQQSYIILKERRSVASVRGMAKQAGLAETEIIRIMPDETDHPTTDDDKCTCLLFMRKEADGIHFIRCTRHVTLGEERIIRGMNLYPIVSLVNSPVKGSARGRGEVLPLISNQIEVNRNLARRIINAKMTAYSRLVYATDKIDNPEALGQVGSAIAVNDSSIAAVHDAVGYVTPAPMSSDAKIICDEMISTSRELAGAGNALTGNIDPTMTSGAAIIAVRDQAQIPLNENVAAFREFVEGVARVWYQLWICYFPAVFGEEMQEFTALELAALRPSVRVDATSVTPFSKYAREQSLQRLLESGLITLEEFARSLDDDSGIPKAQLLEIVKSRKENFDAETQ